MEWEKLSYLSADYYHHIQDAILNNTFINENNVQPDFVQYGVAIIERADLLLRDINQIDIFPDILQCLTTFFDKEPHHFAYYLNRTINVFYYPGLLNSRNKAIKEFWGSIAKKTDDSPDKLYYWLHFLAVALDKDDEMGEKMQFILELSMQECESDEIMEHLLNNFDEIKETYPPDYFIRRLSII
jgi:hypothetical protein